MPYGCYNRQPYRPSTLVQDGVWRWVGRPETVLPRMVQVPYRMTQDCQYTHTDLGQQDPGCAGCKHRKDLSNESDPQAGS